MNIKRTANAHWTGSGKDGNGTVSTQSTVLKDAQYSFKTRFENGVGTNPEELIAAAHAGCFTMKLAFNLQAEGFTADSLNTQCALTLDSDSGSVTTSQLTVKASIPNITKDKFDELVADAEKNCPISKLLNASISVDATLA